MAIPPDWHLQKTPDEWHKIMMAARQQLHIDPNDSEALEAIDYANRAMNAYDQPAIEAGKHVSDIMPVAQRGGDTTTPARLLPGGWGSPMEGLKGIGDLAVGLGRAALHPIATTESLMTEPQELLFDPLRNIATGDPRKAAKGAAGLAMLLAPASRTGKEGPIDPTQPAGPTNPSPPPTLATHAWNAFTKPFRIGKAMSDIPQAKLNQLEASAARATAAKTGIEELASQRRELQPGRVEAQNARAEAARTNATRAQEALDALRTRMAIIREQVNNLPLGTEKMKLINEYKVMQNELMRRRVEGKGEADTEGGPTTSPVEPGPGPTPAPGGAAKPFTPHDIQTNLGRGTKGTKIPKGGKLTADPNTVGDLGGKVRGMDYEGPDLPSATDPFAPTLYQMQRGINRDTNIEVARILEKARNNIRPTAEEIELINIYKAKMQDSPIAPEEWPE